MKTINSSIETKYKNIFTNNFSYNSLIIPFAIIIFLSMIYYIETNFMKGVLIDDAYISMRYAKNFYNGCGLNFNCDGSRVEGYTNFVFTLVMSLSFFLGISPEIWIKIVGVASSLMIIILTYKYLTSRHKSFHLFLLTLTIASDRVLALFSLWGLEITFYPALSLISIYLLIKKKYLASGIILALTSMTRIEAAITIFLPTFTILFLINLYKLKNKKIIPFEFFNTVGCYGFSYLLLFGSYFLIRWHYYGYLLPNTFYAKVATDGAAIPRGLDYLISMLNHNIFGVFFLISFFSIVLILIIQSKNHNLFTWSKENVDILYFVSISVIASFFIVFVGGDHFGSRFIYHYYPFFILITYLGIIHLFNLLSFKNSRFNFIVPFIFFSLLLFLSFFKDYEKSTPNTIGWKNLGLYLYENADENATLAVDAAGAIPYFSQLHSYDMLGLNDPHIAHKEIPGFGQGHAGHEKFDSEYILNLSPDYIAVWNYMNEPQLGLHSFEFHSWYKPLILVDFFGDIDGNMGDLIKIQTRSEFNNDNWQYYLYSRREYPIKPHFIYKGNQLPSQIGQPTEDSLVVDEKNNSQGFLSFGPYINLPPGTYEVSIMYSSSLSRKNVIGYIDVVHGIDTHEIHKELIFGSLGEIEISYILLTLEEQVQELQIRFYFFGEGSVELLQMDIELL